jgi:hypothetical protein
MGQQGRHAAARGLRAALGVVVFACLLSTAIAAPAGAGTEIPRAVDLSTTGNDSELKRGLPISTLQKEKERVAMSLTPDDLPRFQAGDTLRVSAEVQVSTTCVFRGPRCLGRRYEFNPFVTARLVLSSGPELGFPSIAIGAEHQVKCNQRRPNRNHHCTITFPNFEVPVTDPALLPCPDGHCYVNLAVGAWHPKAMRGNRVVLGADRPDGGVVQDKGRLNVAVIDSGTPAPETRSSSFFVNPWLPLNEPKKVKRRVIHSVEVPVARKSDVLTFDASYVANIDRLRHNSLIESRVIVTDGPHSTDPSGLGKSASLLRGAASEDNGFNCTEGPSGYRSPCTVAKSGATRITRDAVDESGDPVPLYINLVSSAKPLLVENVKPNLRVELGPLGGLSVARYPAPPQP